MAALWTTTGDGIMALFGAPVALEDHAIRACLADLDVQEEAKRLAVVVLERDGVNLQLRAGLNSGEVIAGEIGSGPFGYTAVGEQVGMAQRMESAAAPGGVMLSESTARLVEHTAVLGKAEVVHIKGTGQLLSLLFTSDAGEVCNCNLAQAVGLGESTVSHHVSQLRRAGLVESERLCAELDPTCCR
jgi:class 3 adenylate cyclase